MKEFSHEPSALADELLHQFRSHEPYEDGVGLVRHCSRQQGLAVSRGTHKEHPFRGFDTHTLVDIRFDQGKLHRFPYLLLLFVQSTDIFIGDRWSFHHLGTCNDGIPGRGKYLNHIEVLVIHHHPFPDGELDITGVLDHVVDHVIMSDAVLDEYSLLIDPLYDLPHYKGRSSEIFQFRGHFFVVLLQFPI